MALIFKKPFFVWCNQFCSDFEMKQKKLDEAHVECKLEAESRFFDSVEVLAPVQLYNKCMDFHIKMVS